MFSRSIRRLRALSRTVGFRIALWLSATFVVGGIIAFSAAYFLLAHAIDEQTRDTIDFRMRHFASEYSRGGAEAIVRVCNLRRGRAQQAFFVRLASSENRTLFLRDAEDWQEFHPDALAWTPADNNSWMDLQGADEDTILRLESKRLHDGSILQVGRTMEFRAELLSRFQLALIAVAAALIVTGALGGVSIVLRALRPVRSLSATARSIVSTGAFTARVPERGTGDEIDELVKCFNAMLVRIDELVRGMRESLDNVAHDLRTPMTRLRNVATRALEQDRGRTLCHEALADCLEESERVLTMLSTLMDVAEAETGAMKLARSSVPVGALVRQVISNYDEVAEEKQISVAVEISDELRVCGDHGRLRRTFGNLVDNALKYTPDGGRVSVRARRDGEFVEIEVADTGEGIPAQDLPRVWDRLYRVDKSRSQRGLGLGLSLVKAIVEAHGGEVGVESAPGEGSRFLVRLPAEGGKGVEG